MAKATAVRNIRDDHQKAFLKIFNSLCGRFNRWQVWQDFVMVTAIEISNATDKQNAPERTKTYQTIISKYSDAEQNKLDLTLIGNILGVELSQEFVDSSGKDWYKILDEDGVYGTMPEKVLLALAYSSMDSSYCGYWSKDWNVERQKYVYSYRENPTLDATYEMLTALGYEISDDEQALRDGTHKIFREYGPDEKKWSDCDYCKAAHPNCDKCCKTCDEPCNAVQDCKKNEERTENDE